MAAVRQIWANARAVGIGGMVTKDDPAPPDDTQRKIEAKMQAMGYSISPPMPNDALSIRNLDEQNNNNNINNNNTRPLHSKYNNDANTHPLHRKQSIEGSFNPTSNKTNSLDQHNFRPQALQRSTTDTLLQNGLAPQDIHMEDRSSFYNEDADHSPALSPALNKHLALRPLDTQQSQGPYTKGHQRRRSRSATEESQGYNEKNLWDSYAKDRKHKPRQESLRAQQKPTLTNDNTDRTMQMLKDRQNNLSTENNSNNPTNHTRYMDPTPSVATKEAHTFSSPTDSSATASISSGATDRSSKEQPSTSTSSSTATSSTNNSRKRARNPADQLDYTPTQLADMDYTRLRDESFDYIPLSSTPSPHLSQNLPPTTLSLPDRLHAVFNDQRPTATSNPTTSASARAARARSFFASLPIDQYEECGDILLECFGEVMTRLKRARREKREACRGMEQLVAKREEWVRRKRGVTEVELGRLRSAGVAVVRPQGGNGGGGGKGRTASR